MHRDADMAAELRRTWRLVATNADAAMRLFYENLFDASPELQPLFAGTDMAAQRKKLAAALAMVANASEISGSTASALRDLGRRHVQYGVAPVHYDMVGRALIATLEQGLGREFTTPARTAWTTAYGAVAAIMIEGAAAAAPPRSAA